MAVESAERLDGIPKAGDRLYAVAVELGTPRLVTADVIEVPGVGLRLAYYWPGSGQTILVPVGHTGRDRYIWHPTAAAAVDAALAAVERNYAQERAGYTRLLGQ